MCIVAASQSGTAVYVAEVLKEHLAASQSTALSILLHSGIANVSDGAEGELDARRLLSAAAAEAKRGQSGV